MKGFQNSERLQQIMAGPAGLAAFDFDNTLVHGDHGENCMYYLAFQGMIATNSDWFWKELKHDIISEQTIEKLRDDFYELEVYEDQLRLFEWIDSLIDIYRSIYNQAGIEEAYRWTKVLYAGLPDDEMRTISRYVFLDQQRQAMSSLVFPSGQEIPTGLRVVNELKELIQKLIDLNWKVVVVTASPEPLIKEVISEWGLSEEDVIGMRLEKEESRYAPRIIEPMTYGQGKVEALKKLVQENGYDEYSFRLAAGDSYTDLELMKAAENAILIDRGKEELRKIATEQSFLIESFLPENTGAQDPYRPI